MEISLGQGILYYYVISGVITLHHVHLNYEDAKKSVDAIGLVPKKIFYTTMFLVGFLMLPFLIIVKCIGICYDIKIWINRHL